MAREQLEAVSFDHKADEAAFRQDLLNIARTTLSSKILTQALRRPRLTYLRPFTQGCAVYQLPCIVCISAEHRDDQEQLPVAST